MDAIMLTKFEKIFQIIQHPIEDEIYKQRGVEIVSIPELIGNIKKKVVEVNDGKEKTVKDYFANMNRKEILDHLLFYLAAKVSYIFPRGLKELFKENDIISEEESEINYNLFFITPSKLKEHLFGEEKDVSFYTNSGVDSINNNPSNVNNHFSMDLNCQEDCSSKFIPLKKIISLRNEVFQTKMKMSEMAKKIKNSKEFVFDPITEILELSTFWQKAFNKDINLYLEYIDKETKKFFNYIISIHIAFMDVEFNEYMKKYQINPKLLSDEQKKNFKEYYETVKFKYTLLIILRTYSFMTDNQISLNFLNKDQLNAKIFTDEINYIKLGTFFKYRLQLRPYALKYNILNTKCTIKKEEDEKDHKKGKKHKEHQEDNDNSQLLVCSKRNAKEPTELSKYETSRLMKEKIEETKNEFRWIDFNSADIKDHLMFPPTVLFKKNYYEKYKVYDIRDNFLEDDKNDDFPMFSEEYDEDGNIIAYHNPDDIQPNIINGQTIFRSIDKLRLLSASFDHLFKLEKLKSKNILDLFFFNRPDETKKYLNREKSFLFDSLNIFRNSTKFKFIQHFRDYYGEEISFYMLWLQQLILSLIIPSLLCLVLYLVMKFYDPILIEKPILSVFGLQIRGIDIIQIILCIIPTIWCFAFIRHWKSKEKTYQYIWGCQKSEEFEPYQESYRFAKEETYIFDWKLKIQNKTEYFLRRLTSNLISIVLVGLVILVNFYLLILKSNKLQQDPESLFWKYFPTTLNAIFIKVFSFTYKMIAGELSYWENHELNSTRISNLSVKIFLFELVNNFFTYFYIGFYKHSKEDTPDECIKKNCTKEIEVQSYLSLAIFFSINVIEIGIPFVKNWLAIRQIIKEKEKSGLKLQDGEIHQLKHSDELKIHLSSIDSLIDDYVEVIIYLCYVMFITSAAPLTPLFILLLIFAEKFVDAYKIYYLFREEKLNISGGISVYNKLMKIILYVGTFANFAFVLFSRNFEIKMDKTSVEEKMNILTKILVLFILENIVFLISGILNFDDHPDWIDNEDFIKKAYYMLYMDKLREALPHNTLEIINKNVNENVLKRKIYEFYNKNGSNISFLKGEMKMFEDNHHKHEKRCC